MEGGGKQLGAPQAGKLRWVRLPRQGRSREKLERFIAAAERLIGEKGFQATSVPEIARAAGCSVGLFYTRFRDKNDVLRYLLEHYLGETVATARAALRPERWPGVSLAEMLRVFVGGVVRIHRDRPGLVYAFYENLQIDPVLGERVYEIHAEIELLARRMLRARAAEMAHPDPDTAARFGIRLVSGVLHQRALLGRLVPKRHEIPWRLLADELLAALCAYLGVKAPPSPAFDEPKRGKDTP